MPYKSDAQRKFMHARHPEIAKRWDAEAKKSSYKNASNAKQDAIRRRLSYQMKGAKQDLKQRSKPERQAARQGIAVGEPNPAGPSSPLPGRQIGNVVKRRNMLNQFKKQQQKNKAVAAQRGVASRKSDRRNAAMARRLEIQKRK